MQNRIDRTCAVCYIRARVRSRCDLCILCAIFQDRSDRRTPLKQRRDSLCGAVSVNKRQNKRQIRFPSKKRTRKLRVCEQLYHKTSIYQQCSTKLRTISEPVVCITIQVLFNNCLFTLGDSKYRKEQ